MSPCFMRVNTAFGVPVFAPLLFAELTVLALFGLWDLHLKAESPSEPGAT